VACVRTATHRHLYIDGKLAASTTHPIEAAKVVGNQSHMILQHVGAHEVLLEEIRISLTVRYAANFQPKDCFETDEHTLAIYHRDEGKGDTFQDSSGRNLHGKLQSAQWA
jgi:hypothetical protein